MSTLRRWQVSGISTAFAGSVLIACCFPVNASNLPIARLMDDQRWTESLEFAALTPFAADHSMQTDREANRRKLALQLDEAKDLLERLRVFAETAERAIETGRRIETLRSESKQLRKALSAEKIGRHHLHDSAADASVRSNHLSKTVIGNWLISQELKQQEARVDTKLAKARANWAITAMRLDNLLEERERQRQETRDLRAEIAALAVEIGRTKRQIVNVMWETQLIEDHRLVIQAATRQLRHEVSSRLRNILTANGMPHQAN